MIGNWPASINRTAAALRRYPGLIISVLLFGSGLFIPTPIDPGSSGTGATTGPYTVLDAPTFEVQLSRGWLELTATTASRKQQAGLKKFIADRFADHGTRLTFIPAIKVPDSWDTMSKGLLNALAATESATASVRDSDISIRGVTAEPEAFAARLNLMRTALPANTVIDLDVTTLADTASLDALCRRTFAEIVAEPVAFEHSSAEIRTSSYSMLDKLIDFAYSCRHVQIVITGHTDASGDESWNLRLSRLRAQAVADYLARGGIAAERLRVDGKGSSIPIADNSTRYGRSLNRRIDFALSQPLL